MTKRSKRIATKYTGVFYYETITNSKSDKVYYIAYKDEHNRRKEKKIGKYSEGVREAYCNTLRNDAVLSMRLGKDKPHFIAVSEQTKITMDELAQKHYDYKALHNRRNERARNLFTNHISPFIGKKFISEVSVEDLEAIQTAKVNEGKSPKYCNDIINEVSVNINFAIERDLFNGINPAKKIKKLKIDNARERFLNVDEIKDLIREVENDEQLLIFVLMALTTGGRLKSLLMVKKKDIDFKNKIIKLLDEKNQQTYNAFLENKKLYDLLKERVKSLSANDIVLDYHDGYYERLDDYIYSQLKPVFDELFNKGLKSNDRKNRVVTHTLRHTFASNLAINGVPILTIQKLMNHKDINMTLRYAKLSPDNGREAIKGLL